MNNNQTFDPKDYSIERGEPLPLRTTTDIRSSKIGIGFETLDRQLFTPEKCYAPLALLGAKWARCQTGWGRTETVPGQYDFAWLDSIVDELRKAGVQPWLSISFGNGLYIQDVHHESAVGCAPIYTKEAREAWLRYTAALVDHFKDRVSDWEIWNEPNTGFWRNAEPNGKDYTTLVKITAEVIRAQQKNARVIGGAVSGCDIGFITQCVASGICEHIDAFSFHPYVESPEHNYASFIRTLRSLLKGRPIELWQGECGCPSRSGGHGDDWKNQQVNELFQAKWLVRRLMTDLIADIDHTQYFCAADFGIETPYVQSQPEPANPIYMGILEGVTYRPKLAFHAMRSICSYFDEETVLDDLYCEEQFCNQLGADHFDPRATCTSFRRNGVPMLVYYDAGRKPDATYPARPTKIVATIRDDSLFADPVLIDPISNTIYPIKAAHLFFSGHVSHDLGEAKGKSGIYVFDGVPLTDYPLIITDRRIVETNGEKPQSSEVMK